METAYQRQPEDTVTIHQRVLRTLVSEAALSIPGIVRMAYTSRAVNWLRLGLSEGGIRLIVENDEITVDLALIVDAQRNLQVLSRAVQQEVARTLREYVGLIVQAVNVHIEDVVFGIETA
jgi:uncharacterized alkaline shock family protein YloU